jgi:large subunit ribosomal protein L6
MSRIGRKPVSVPANVKVALNDNNLRVEGPNGTLEYQYRPEVSVRFDEASRTLVVERQNDERISRALHGLTRSLVQNMVQGVTEGYTKKLEIVGVGYQAQLKKANAIELQVGYANRIVMEAPEGVKVVLTDPTHVTITGADKQKVGQFAAEVRRVRPRARPSARSKRTEQASRIRISKSQAGPPVGIGGPLGRNVERIAS